MLGPLSVAVIVCLALAIACEAAPAPGTPHPLCLAPADLAIALGERATPVERRAAELLAAEVKHRTGAELGHAGRYTVCLGTPASSDAVAAYGAKHPAALRLGEGGFHLSTVADAKGRLFVIGHDPSGVVAGVGKLLRAMHYAASALGIPAIRLNDSPTLPVRGIYLATHFENFYHVAPVEEVDEIIEDFALWGGNSLAVWFDMHHFTGFDDPAAQKHLARLKHFGETANRVGMHFGVVFLANEAYSTSPKELRATWREGQAHYHVELCPSKPEGLALIGKWQAQVINSFSNLDFTWSWPYDQGGCMCEQCKPWGGHGFLIASEQLARLFHERFPNGKLWLSTWLLDHPTQGAEGGGEYAALFQYMRDKQPQWLTGILAGTHGDIIPHQLHERPNPERYPLTCFPEISMYRMNPWGGAGANPLPEFCTRLASDMKGQIVGGWPYSEGIYEDLNKFIWARLYWSPEAKTDEILAEYASYHLSPEVAPDAVKLFHLLEATHTRSNWRVENLAQADEAFALAQSIDARLPAYAKSSWRWRLLYIRAAIDHTLKHRGYVSEEAQAALRPLAAEIVRIYHSENSWIGPPGFPKPRDPNDLAHGRAVQVSSTHPDCIDSARALTDGILSQEDGENFWAQDPATDKAPTLVVDLGAARDIREVRLQFRGLYGEYWFVPQSVAFEVSDDGAQYAPVKTSDKVPQEHAAYSPDFWAYPIGKRGRYLQLKLGPSQHAGDQYAGIVELTEIEVHGG